VVLDTDGNVFGGFTTMRCESREWNGKPRTESNTGKADESLERFLFTLKNPHDISPRPVMPNAEEKWRAIRCNSGRGPFFGNDIVVSDRCNESACSATSVGPAYTNDR
jgi:hypothetical protein